MSLDLRQGLFLVVRQILSTMQSHVCVLYHLRSHVNKTLKVQKTKGSKLGCTFR